LQLMPTQGSHRIWSIAGFLATTFEADVLRGRANALAELRAGQERRPPAARWLPRPTNASEGAKCSQRAAMQLGSPVPANGPRVSSSGELAGPRSRNLPYLRSRNEC
jgi:hypothetical protein